VLGGVTADDEADEGDHHLTADHAILGPVLLPTAQVDVTDSVIDGSSGGDAVNAPSVRLDRVTVLGTVRAGELHAADTIFAGDVTVERRQAGLLRYCYVPPGARTPPRFRCQPDLAAAAGDPVEVAGRVRPAFRSVAYGAYGYADLDPAGPVEIAAGAEDGTELGAFSGRMAPQRDAALRAALDEYLPYGLEAGIIDVP
jgi:hypothetical protein